MTFTDEAVVHIGMIETTIAQPRKPAVRKAAYDLLCRMAIGCAGLPAEELEIVSSDSGKPSWRLHPEIHFSLSHSGPVAVCALSRFPVGIDLELMAPRRWWREIAARWFTEKESALLELQGSEAEQTFYHLWTRKEAWLKLHGKAIWRLSEAPDTNQADSGFHFLTWEGGTETRFSLSLCLAPGDTGVTVLFPKPYVPAGLDVRPITDNRLFSA